jgi:GTPase SAR1 family protein
VIVGNKSDSDDRVVSFLEGVSLAQENSCLFLETSALTGDNVDEVFLILARNLLTKIDIGMLDMINVSQSGASTSKNSSRRNNTVESGGCCF